MCRIFTMDLIHFTLHRTEYDIFIFIYLNILTQKRNISHTSQHVFKAADDATICLSEKEMCATQETDNLTVHLNTYTASKSERWLFTFFTVSYGAAVKTCGRTTAELVVEGVHFGNKYAHDSPIMCFVCTSSFLGYIIVFANKQQRENQEPKRICAYDTFDRFDRF